VNRSIYFLLIIIFLSGCSLGESSKLWPTSEKINQDKNINKEKKTQEIFSKKNIINEEFNPNLKIKINDNFYTKDFAYINSNNNGRVNFNGELERVSRYKFSKIKNFYQYEPEIIFDNKDIIFSENKGSILRFNENSKLVWEKNYYSKTEKKLNPILQLANNDQFLIVTDNIAKLYMLDVLTGDLIWSKNNSSPFNSQIKIYKDKFLTVDFSNTLRCFSIKNGNELWNIKTQSSLIRSQKKLSLVIVKDKIFFNNSIGDITAVDLNNGELLWQLPTQSSLIYDSAFSLETSDLITENKTLFFSNNKNQFFSIDIDTGSFNWETTINSSLRPTLVENIIFTVSSEGYLFLVDKKKGNIIRTTYLFDKFKEKKRKSLSPTGFILGSEKIYLSTSSGRLLVVDIATGKTISVLKIDNEKILRPAISSENLFIVKNNAIIKFN
jgi:outer membrane protein assembly factor BamB